MKRTTLLEKNLMLAGALAAFCAAPLAGRAAVLASYDFATAAPFNSVDTDPNSTAGAFTFASGLSANSGRSTTAPNVNTIFTRGTSVGTTAAGALSGNDYYTFTLTPTAGYEMDLTNLTFLTDATVASGANSYTANIFVRSSLDGFASDIGATITDSSNTGSSYVTQTVDLSAVSFQNITTSVEFRVYLYHTGANPTDNNSVTRSDSYTLNGAVTPVPEPSAWALLTVGSVAWLVRRRRFVS